MRVEVSAVIDVVDEEFVSRAGAKLAGALDALDRASTPVRIDGTRCVDLGASTGGFTEVLLSRGAKHVEAVDVGHDQLVPELRDDPRVHSHEGTNVRGLTPGAFGPVDVIVGDLSFISLSLVVPVVAGLSIEQTDVLLLVKPQFEVGRERLGSSGVVRSLEQRAEAVVSVAGAAAQAGLRCTALVPSSLPGPNGNREFFLRWQRGDVVGDPIPSAVVAEAVRWESANESHVGHPAWVARTAGWELVS